jgi:hypothetical protein
MRVCTKDLHSFCQSQALIGPFVLGVAHNAQAVRNFLAIEYRWQGVKEPETLSELQACPSALAPLPLFPALNQSCHRIYALF